MKNMLEVFVDGGSRGNPGYSACAFSVRKNGVVVFEAARFLGVATNNQAEYMGVILALDWIFHNENKSDSVMHLDSQLVARQMSGQYKIKNSGLKKLFEIAKNLERKIKGSVTYVSIERAKNSRPDELLNQVLDHMVN